MKPRVPWAIVPVKRFTDGKSRLAPGLDDAARSRLARGMFEHVLGALIESRVLSGVLVITDDEEAGATAVRAARAPLAPPIEVLAQPGAPGLRPTVETAIRRVKSIGADAAIVVLADLPRLGPEEVARFVALLDDAEVVVAPDRADFGTNALALCPPDVIENCFGGGASFQRHLAEIARRGARHAVLRSPGLALDLDEPSDLTRLLAEA